MKERDEETYSMQMVSKKVQIAIQKEVKKKKSLCNNKGSIHKGK
jgi:hypothetical protein